MPDDLLGEAEWQRSLEAVAKAQGKSINAKTMAPTAIMDAATLIQKVYGQKLAAYLCGVTDPRLIGKWARGKEIPHQFHIPYLRTLYDITNILLMRMEAKDAQRWISQPCAYLDNRLPMDELAIDAEMVRMAATRLLVT